MKGANIKCLSYENIYQKYSLNKKMPVCFWCVFEVFKSIYDIMLEGFFLQHYLDQVEKFKKLKEYTIRNSLRGEVNFSFVSGFGNFWNVASVKLI